VFIFIKPSGFTCL